MANVNIDRLNLTIENARGHEHRVAPIARHAADIFTTRLDEQLKSAGRQPSSTDLDALSASPLRFDLRSMSDAQAANAIADAWLNAVQLKLRF